MGETNWVWFWWAGPCSKSLIQFSVDGQGFVPSMLFDLRPNYGGGNGDNGDLLQKIPCRHCYTQCPQHCSRPLPTHASAGDSWTLMGKSGSVSCGITASFSWVLMCPFLIETVRLAKKFVWVFCTIWWKNPNKYFGQINTGQLICRREAILFLVALAPSRIPHYILGTY